MYIVFDNEHVTLITEVSNDKTGLAFNLCWNIYCEMLILFFTFSKYTHHWCSYQALRTNYSITQIRVKFKSFSQQITKKEAQ